MRTPPPAADPASLDESLAALDGEIPTVTREHARALIEEFLAAGGAKQEPGIDRAPIRLALLPGRLRVEGTMHRAPFPSSRPESPIKRRGLDLVEQLADRWGIVEGKPLGFWFELNCR